MRVRGAWLHRVQYTEATTQILAGTYIPPPGIEAFITNLILEISLIAKEIRAGSVSFTITIDDFIYYSTGGASMSGPPLPSPANILGITRLQPTFIIGGLVMCMS